VTQVLGRATAVRTRPHVNQARQGRTARFEGWRAYPTAGRRYIDSAFAPVFRATAGWTATSCSSATSPRSAGGRTSWRGATASSRRCWTRSRRAFCLTDLDRRYRYVNREFCEFAGKRPEEIIGLTSEELVGRR
jgi:PAS domain-containing protein